MRRVASKNVQQLKTFGGYDIGTIVNRNHPVKSNSGTLWVPSLKRGHLRRDGWHVFSVMASVHCVTWIIELPQSCPSLSPGFEDLRFFSG